MVKKINFAIMKKSFLLMVCVAACCGRLFAVRTSVVGYGNDIPASAMLVIDAAPLAGNPVDSRVIDDLSGMLVVASRMNKYYACELGKVGEADKTRMAQNVEELYFVYARYGVESDPDLEAGYFYTMRLTVYNFFDFTRNGEKAKAIYRMATVAVPTNTVRTMYDIVPFMVFASKEHLYHPTDGIVDRVYADDSFPQ